MRIESLEKWSEYAAWLSANGYSMYMSQYGIDRPEGFHAWFLQHETPGVEVITHSEAVRDAIYKFPDGDWLSHQ